MRKVVYTINFDNYETFKEPLVVTEGWDYVYFTDQDYKSKVWDVRKVKPLENGHLSARYYYINSCEVLPEYDLSVKFGGMMNINCNIDDFIEKRCDLVKDINLMEHCRNCIFDEAEENKRIFRHKKEWCKKIDRQMERYRIEGMPTNYGLYAHGLMIRRNSDRMKEHERLWWEEVKNPDYVTRDQLSFMYVLWKYKLISVNGFEGYWDILANEFPICKHGSDIRICR